MPCSVRGVLNTRSLPSGITIRDVLLRWETSTLPNSSASPYYKIHQRLYDRLVNRLLTIVHLKTPPKATSSPKTTAVSSLDKVMAMASLIAWYVFILRVSLPPRMTLEGEETQVRPGEWRAESRLDLRRMDEAKAGKWPPAGGG